MQTGTHTQSTAKPPPRARLWTWKAVVATSLQSTAINGVWGSVVFGRILRTSISLFSGDWCLDSLPLLGGTKKMKSSPCSLLGTLWTQMLLNHREESNHEVQITDSKTGQGSTRKIVLFNYRHLAGYCSWQSLSRR
jgi:hypothetical protein